MKGPALLLRGNALPQGCKNLGPLYEWEEGAASLVLDEVELEGHRGAVTVYTNPPVHQIGNPGLDAMLTGLGALDAKELEFLLLTWPCDPVHAGGDLKESAIRLEKTHARRDELEASDAPHEQIDALYDWADGRLDKGQALYRLLRRLSRRMRTVGVCGGGTRFGGSAEVNLMADLLVGDSRSGMCFSEVMIGLIPGWAGVGRALTKAGAINTRWMTQTGAQVRAADLERIGIYDAVVNLDIPFPKKGRTGDKVGDAARHAAALAEHDATIWPKLLSTALTLATGSADPKVSEQKGAETLATEAQIADEVSRRAAPETYRDIWDKPLSEAASELKNLGRPLAPQSVAELNALLDGASGADTDEDAFVEAEKQADARLYRDRRLARGIQATLGQRVTDFREI